VFLGIQVSLTWVGFDERAINFHQGGSGMNHADVWSAGERVEGRVEWSEGWVAEVETLVVCEKAETESPEFIQGMFGLFDAVLRGLVVCYFERGARGRGQVLTQSQCKAGGRQRRTRSAWGTSCEAVLPCR